MVRMNIAGIAAVFCATINGLWALDAFSDVRLPALVGDGMVLQRNAPIRVWGWATPRETVRVEFQGKRFTGQTDRTGRWFIALGAYRAGGPYEMSVVGKNSIKLRDILIGDVWLASGQSNMEMPLKVGKEWQGGITNADQEIATAYFPRIRLFSVNKTTAATPVQDVSSAGWRAVTPESVAEFSGVAYFFGRELHQRYEVPIGMIQSAWGGTVAEAWTSEKGLKRLPEFRASIDSLSEVLESQADYRHAVQQRNEWYQRQGAKDRGQLDGHAIWADPEFDASGWPPISVPRPKDSCGKDLGDFGGVVWFRRTIEVPPQHAGKELRLQLGRLVKDDITYFNGRKVGETHGYENARNYAAPGEIVRAGHNTLIIRLDGYRSEWMSCTGMYFLDDRMTAEVGGATIPLDGTWTYQPGPDLNDFVVFDADTATAARSFPNYPTALFNGMIHPLTPFTIRGVIWYQGEANASDHARAMQYRTLFPALIQDWRKHWGYDFPFLFVQLAGFGPNKPEPANYSWAELREAQSMTLSLPHTGMATAIDIGEEKDIHPKNKQDVAKRLVLAARKVAYGENIVYSGPTYQSMRVEGDRIRIQFSSTGSGLLVKDLYGYVRGFQIAGAHGKFVWAHAEPEGDDMIVFNDSIDRPTAVRYGWSNTPDGNVYNKEGLPAAPFRTDGQANPSDGASLTNSLP